MREKGPTSVGIRKGSYQLVLKDENRAEKEGLLLLPCQHTPLSSHLLLLAWQIESQLVLLKGGVGWGKIHFAKQPPTAKRKAQSNPLRGFGVGVQ